MKRPTQEEIVKRQHTGHLLCNIHDVITSRDEHGGLVITLQLNPWFDEKAPAIVFQIGRGNVEKIMRRLRAAGLPGGNPARLPVLRSKHIWVHRSEIVEIKAQNWDYKA